MELYSRSKRSYHRVHRKRSRSPGKGGPPSKIFLLNLKNNKLFEACCNDPNRYSNIFKLFKLSLNNCYF